ncbi:Murein DD-endopeptidase MepM and murein hydrolase activator NlpD, contain LysM domain [Flavobacterium glycines]|uniref:Murein DD-endopeptidase MepM and murein hydrolase activator NlpD, contain LysM domain n=1 Tax=Flavobacterium glycines TaxID=551990 RepID=A0A1B9DTM5_9FLAO|nr:peptidoglycan DD-metalloendopeptidase family protein [Flavobacterium glycines]OCB73053.1 peptidase M23 [Flavobacterium glycines]GEL10199.1 peptidase M23 [Flavobacterium glycines]SDI77349.1 Murein DD-endopeptidase MepM and murein hydrolase activator NlpD, contain LysM domain [Flavobacterium glycines]
MKYVLTFIIALTLVVSCKNSDKETDGVKVAKKETSKKDNSDFGFNFADYNVIQDTVRKGDTFGTIIEGQNIGDRKIYEIVNSIKDTFDVRGIRPDKTYTMLRSKDKTNKLQVFIYEPNDLSYYIFDLRDSAVVAHKKVRPVTYKRRVITGVLKGSLSETLANSGVEANLANQITKIYSWSIDFFKLKKGDRFGIAFNERYINDSIYNGVSNIEAAFFEYKGKIMYAFPFVQNQSSGKVDYYDEDGKTMKNFFLKSPIKFSRITSRFTMNRFHPVQHRWKAHKGTDYAAPTGTPIMTTAAGVVETTGYTAGNGNFVKVKHNGTYATQYLHMSKILVRRGQRVNQGDVIGRVGSTGLASGPHVCYRFWKNGVQVDALKLKLPTGTPMEGGNKARFMKTIEPLKRELDSVGNL